MLVALVVLMTLGLPFAPAGAQPRVETTPADFVQPGTQPAAGLGLLTSSVCRGCHGQYDESGDVEPWDGWVATMMAQAARDPVTRAAAAIAGVDAGQAVETCIRCHAPIGWLAGRSADADFDALAPGDLDGVTCHVCHRLTDPIARADSPAPDAAIHAALDLVGVRPTGTCRAQPQVACSSDAACGAAGPCDVGAGQGRFVIDPEDRRRGPYEIPFVPHQVVFSPYHRRADVCAPCHDVSTPTYSRQPDDTYALNPLGAPHPTQNPHDMFPEQRTFSEWRASAFATTGVVFPDGRFGGLRTATLPNVVPVATCQDCHMPTVNAAGCSGGSGRSDLAQHVFPGANTWVLGAILEQYGAASGLTAASVAAAEARTAEMLAKAADVELTQTGAALAVRVVNQTGHKLPTGYPEGRRMWLEVRFYAGDTLVAADGAYDEGTAILDHAATTRIWEAVHTIDAAVGAATGLAAGTPFHLALNNVVAFDNRIPPRGFTNAAFEAIGAAPVGQAYADGQHWDDTTYAIPEGATRVLVRLRFQTTTREYAEFLRDGTPDDTGPTVYALWESQGRSAPALLAEVAADLAPRCTPADGPCCGVAEGGACDDADACTSGDACRAAVCAGTVQSWDDVRCALGALAAPPACATAPKSFRKQIAARLRAAGKGLAAARRLADKGAAARKLRRPLAKADKALRQLGSRATTAAGAPPAKRIEAACAEAVTAATGRLRAAIGALRTGS
ncbi:MAG: hypothetical protein KIT14_16615 [bacterium]|nr:hypothetical protein [bacterium]